jgi:hypothetical protein
MIKFTKAFILFFLIISSGLSFALDREERRKEELDELQKEFSWWPTDAKAGPVKDDERGGYWWWPNQPGKIMPWGTEAMFMYIKLSLIIRQKNYLRQNRKNYGHRCLLRR